MLVSDLLAIAYRTEECRRLRLQGKSALRIANSSYNANRSVPPEHSSEKEAFMYFQRSLLIA